MKTKTDFIHALAEFLVKDQTRQSAELEMRKPSALAWRTARQSTLSRSLSDRTPNTAS